jgi:cyclopropane-fatty-acyl-phospholipid synthase
MSSKFHYDIGNDLYRLFLDETMTYSCALWDGEELSLKDAQIKKLRYHANNLEIKDLAEPFILDIGCGWGSMMKLLSEEYNAKTVGITISKEQKDYILKTEKISKNSVLLIDWTEYRSEVPFDGIVSIGVIEEICSWKVPKDERISIYYSFFKKCHMLSKPDSYLSLQSIIQGPLFEENTGFILQEVFPQSSIPSIEELIIAFRKFYEIINLRNDRKDYFNTAKHWLINLKRNREEIVNLYGTERYEFFEKYLSMCVGVFAKRIAGLARIKFRRLP